MHSMHAQLPENRLVELRKERNVSIMDVAVACGVHTSTVSRWQDGVIPQRHLPVLAALLGVSVPYLAGWTDEESSS
jgi:transcriptional regulator with XRE-family HTH domain